MSFFNNITKDYQNHFGTLHINDLVKISFYLPTWALDQQDRLEEIVSATRIDLGVGGLFLPSFWNQNVYEDVKRRLKKEELNEIIWDAFMDPLYYDPKFEFTDEDKRSEFLDSYSASLFMRFSAAREIARSLVKHRGPLVLYRSLYPKKTYPEGALSSKDDLWIACAILAIRSGYIEKRQFKMDFIICPSRQDPPQEVELFINRALQILEKEEDVLLVTSFDFQKSDLFQKSIAPLLLKKKAGEPWLNFEGEKLMALERFYYKPEDLR